jgi:hypothetical protein
MLDALKDKRFLTSRRTFGADAGMTEHFLDAPSLSNGHGRHIQRFGYGPE